VIEHQRLDPGIGGPGETGGTGPVGNDYRNTRPKTPITYGVDQRLKVAATP
jgi:hypothetical protein